MEACRKRAADISEDSNAVNGFLVEAVLGYIDQRVGQR